MLRVGSGHDTHRLAEGRPLVLGGVRLDHPRGLVGHSDADVVLHAVTDALLGAAGLGDIGDLYPDTDPQYRGADSAAWDSTAASSQRPSRSRWCRLIARAEPSLAIAPLTRDQASSATWASWRRHGRSSVK